MYCACRHKLKDLVSICCVEVMVPHLLGLAQAIVHSDLMGVANTVGVTGAAHSSLIAVPIICRHHL